MRNVWSREETLIAFGIYCRTPFGRLHARNPEIVEIARSMGRTANALAMKCCNLAAFDSAQKSRGIKGLSKASRLDGEIWRDFAAHPEDIAFEAEQALARVMDRAPLMASDVHWEDVKGLDKQTLTKVRVNQQFFRSMILSGYRNQCAVCRLPFTELLVASHIVPWAKDDGLRMNPTNGLCLCVLHDRAYDYGLLLIDARYRISVSAKVDEKKVLPPVASGFHRYRGRKIALPDRWAPDPTLLSRHAELLLSRNLTLAVTAN